MQSDAAGNNVHYTSNLDEPTFNQNRHLCTNAGGVLFWSDGHIAFNLITSCFFLLTWPVNYNASWSTTRANLHQLFAEQLAMDASQPFCLRLAQHCEIISSNCKLDIIARLFLQPFEHVPYNLLLASSILLPTWLVGGQCIQIAANCGNPLKFFS